MNLYLFSFRMELIQIIADELRKKSHSCVCFNNMNSFLCAINTGKKAPDLAIIDYTVWNHQLYDFGAYQRKHNLFLPFIYFNDPCPMGPYIIHWEIMLNTMLIKFPGRIRKEQEELFINRFKTILKDLSQIVNSEILKPYIPLIQKAKDLPEGLPIKNPLDYLSKLTPKSFDFNKFKEKVNLPPSSEFIFKIFLANVEKPLSVANICEEYHKQSKEMSEKSVGPVISKLKQYLRKDEDCPYVISSENKNYVLLYKS